MTHIQARDDRRPVYWTACVHPVTDMETGFELSVPEINVYETRRDACARQLTLAQIHTERRVFGFRARWTGAQWVLQEDSPFPSVPDAAADTQAALHARRRVVVRKAVVATLTARIARNFSRALDDMAANAEAPVQPC